VFFSRIFYSVYFLCRMRMKVPNLTENKSTKYVMWWLVSCSSDVSHTQMDSRSLLMPMLCPAYIFGTKLELICTPLIQSSWFFFFLRKNFVIVWYWEYWNVQTKLAEEIHHSPSSIADAVWIYMGVQFKFFKSPNYADMKIYL
jgi:hypothetical protein